MVKHVALALTTLLLPVGVTFAQVQADPAQIELAAPPAKEKRFTLELNSAEIREALRNFFQSAGESYVLDNDVDGIVTLKIKDQPFETVLRLLLKGSSNPLTYRKEAGVYLIVPRQAEAPVSERTPVSLDLRDASLRATLEKLLKSANKQFSIGPEVSGTVTMQLRDTDLNTVLTELLRGTSYEWRLNNNIYLIGKRSSTETSQGSGERLPGKGSGQKSESRVIPVSQLPAAELMHQLEKILPEGVDKILVQPSTNSLLAFSSDLQAIEALRERVQLLDVQGEQIPLKAEVLQLDERGAKTVLFSTSVQTRGGSPATISDKATGAAASASSIRILLTPTVLPGRVEVASTWELSLPLTGTRGSIVRLEKSLTATAQLLPGKSVVVGETKRSQNGIKEQLQLVLTWEATRVTR